MSNVFVFRVANDEYIISELREGRLRQGWGGVCSKLPAERGDKEKEDWIKRMTKDSEEANWKYYSTKYNNLMKMLDIEVNDIIIIPKMPTTSQFTICRASGKYEFTEPRGYKGDDFYHMIPIDVKSIRYFNYHADEKCLNIHAKLRAYQSPINHVCNESLIDVANGLIESENNVNEQSTLDIVKEIRDDIYRSDLIERFRNLGNREIEKISRLIFENLGYECISSNNYDRQGGDADLIFADKSLSELMDIGVNGWDISGKIYVQIKNKVGKDYSDIEGIKQLIIRTADEAVSTKILISTADSFTEECRNLANANNILLIDGTGFLKLIFKYIE